MNLRLDLIWEIKMSVIDVENASLQLNFLGNQLIPRKHLFPTKHWKQVVGVGVLVPPRVPRIERAEAAVRRHCRPAHGLSPSVSSHSSTKLETWNQQSSTELISLPIHMHMRMQRISPGGESERERYLGGNLGVTIRRKGSSCREWGISAGLKKVLPLEENREDQKEIQRKVIGY